MSPILGAGKFLVSTNKLYWRLSTGFAYTIENYTDKNLNKTSLESVISSTFNVFDLKDFELDSNINIFPSLSEKGRTRVGFDTKLKYNLPFDFYLKLGFTLNYDNQPAIIGNDTDYYFSSEFGWKFN
ncbi:DUF481 domain-containing protein [Tamlana sp. 2201CG12-4]|uniref:DUF481 domain-containing protein n=1 Tax=Tamlana sp. 2201CG12-4 TaxID=3112582 RepID=UPI002DBC2FEA|nr:DUF481 domain-containing protein [Tamlana sp. 2201CG12-4]MEC3906977.1 DUF481 domain-containing protein [Tamlana sp. 2201CG12-4]